MTVDKMEKAKEISDFIKYLKEQARRIDLVDGEKPTEITSNNKSFSLPLDIKEMIITICRTRYEKRIKEKEKEFEEL